MIALKHALPLVRSSHGNSVAFEKLWLRISLQDAAKRAGYDSWWLVDDLVAGIALYLRDCYTKNVIDVPELESMVRAALRNIGYEEVAVRFNAIPTTRGISLAQILETTAAVNRTTFFDQLAETITALHKAQVRHFHFYDLHFCIDQLESESEPDRTSRTHTLRERIVSFVREQVRLQGWGQPVWCSIS